MVKHNVTHGIPPEENNFSNEITSVLEDLGFLFSEYFNVQVMRDKVVKEIVKGKIYYVEEYPELCVVAMDDDSFAVSQIENIDASIEHDTGKEGIIKKLEKRGYSNIERQSKLNKILQ